MFHEGKQIRHSTLIVILSLILIAVIGFGIYFIMNQSKQNNSSKNEITQIPATQPNNNSVNSENVNKPVITNLNVNTSTPSATGYNYSGHSNFKTFWADFKKAIISNDRDAVAEMTFIPFRDQFQEVIFNSSGGEKPLTANSKSDFLSKYDKIIIPETIIAVKANRYRTYEYEELIGGDVIAKGEYVLMVSSEKPRIYDLAFAKKNGVFKLSYIPFYP